MNAFVAVSLLPRSSFSRHQYQKTTPINQTLFTHFCRVLSRSPTLCAVQPSAKSSQTPSVIKDLLQDALEGLNAGLQIDPDADTMDEDEAEVMFRLYCNPLCCTVTILRVTHIL